LRYYCRFWMHYDEVDVTACRIKLFERKTGFIHDLDYKFKESKVVDITEEHTFVQLSASSTIIKREALEGLRLSNNLFITEDVPFINEIILKRGKYAVSRDAVYEYRKRRENNSKVDSRKENKSWYIPVVRNVYGRLIDMSKEKYGQVISYIQYLITYDIKWKFAEPIPDSILDDNEKKDYIALLHQTMEQIDDNIICEVKKTPLNLKAYMLQFKGASTEVAGTYITNHARVLLDIAGIENGHLHLEGRDRSELFDDTHSVVVKGKNGNYPLDYYKAPYLDTKTVEGKTVFQGRVFRVDLPLKPGEQFEFHIVNNRDGSSRIMGMGYGRFSRLTDVKNSFFKAGHCLVLSDGRVIRMTDANRKIIKTLGGAFDNILKKTCSDSVYRIRKRAEALHKGKPILLLVDRGDRAGDNAEALFKYLCSSKLKRKYRIYFAVSKDSPDFTRLSEYGNMVDYGSEEYLALFLASDKLISSQWAYWLLTPFGSDQKYVQDMIKHEFVFLQHGVTFGDMSSWGCKQKRNISLFITSAKKEHESIIRNEAYGYKKEQIALTGFARNDYLIDRRERLVVFAPTWRKYMNLDSISGSYKLAESNAFAETEYCRFYNRMINDERIVGVMKRKGYNGLFCVHPLFTNNRDAFVGNDVIKIAEPDFSYNDVICRSSLMVTDYSSVVADHAYMKKPVVYSQFDEKLFFGSHTSDKGYFNYDTDGFGPVTYNYEDTVSTIVNMIELDCPEDSMYEERVDRFFAYTDHENCRRICEAIGL